MTNKSDGRSGPGSRSERYLSADLGAAFNRFSEFVLLGEGGFGSVFSVWDNVKRQYVALKITRDTAEAAWRQRFEQEYEILRTVHSDRLVRVYDSGERKIRLVDGAVCPHLWFTMEKCSNCIEKEWDRLSPRERARVCLQLLEGLAVLHERNIAHRDIKPKNLFLSRSGDLKIGDFGIAKVNSAVSTQLTPVGNCIGTFEFLAPERWRGTDDEVPDWRPGDQYAAGCTIYLILSRGTTALDFGAGNQFACLNAHLTGQVRPLALPDLPGERYREVDRVLKRMLAKEPERRFPSIAKCKLELELAFKQHGLM